MADPAPNPPASPPAVDLADHIEWAEAIATSIGRELRFDRRGQDVEDLIGVALLHLADRARAFDPARVPPGGDAGGAFRGLAHPTIKHAVVREAKRLRNGGTYNTRREDQHAGPVRVSTASAMAAADGERGWTFPDHREPDDVGPQIGEAFWAAARAVLGEADAEVLELHVRGGFDVEQVAWLCQRTPKWVAGAIARGMEALKAEAAALRGHAADYADADEPAPPPRPAPVVQAGPDEPTFTRRAVESRPIQSAVPVLPIRPEPRPVPERSAPMTPTLKVAAEPASSPRVALVELLAAVDPADAAAAIEAELLRLERRAAVLTAVRDALVGADGRGLAG